MVFIIHKYREDVYNMVKMLDRRKYYARVIYKKDYAIIYKNKELGLKKNVKKFRGIFYVKSN